MGKDYVDRFAADRIAADQFAAGGVFSRRLVLTGGAAAGLTAALAACETAPDTESGSSEATSSDRATEAPELAEMVEAGELPPLAERLPENPLVVEPFDDVASYGGTWRTLLLGQNGTDMYRTLAYDMLVRWDVEWTEIVPNLVESWEVSDDGTEYTFHLRRGIRWSDGEPFTAADIAFAYEGVIMDPELTPASTQEFTAGGEHAVLEQLDDYAVKWTFREPNGLFLDRLASPGFATSRIVLPKHYFEEFHPDYGDGVEERAQEEGFDNWRDYFLSKGGGGTIATEYWANEVPTLFPWRVTSGLTDTRLEVGRNPYYWKTDNDGRQLPFLDGVVLEIVDEPETMLLKAANGEVDFDANPYGFCTLANKPVLAESREDGEYDFVDVTDSRSNYVVIEFNLNHDDVVLRDLFNNLDFRIGLSHAINRDEIINVVFQRQGEPWQVAPRPESEFYDEEYAKQYTEYDVELANSHLDAAGIGERDSDGIRLRPDGQPVAFNILVTPEETETNGTLELVKDYWREVGVDLTIASVSGDLKRDRLMANQYDTMSNTAFYGMQDGILYPNWYLVHRPDTARAPPNGASGMRQVVKVVRSRRRACDGSLRSMMRSR